MRTMPHHATVDSVGILQVSKLLQRDEGAKNFHPMAQGIAFEQGL